MFHILYQNISKLPTPSVTDTDWLTLQVLVAHTRPVHISWNDTSGSIMRLVKHNYVSYIDQYIHQLPTRPVNDRYWLTLQVLLSHSWPLHILRIDNGRLRCRTSPIHLCIIYLTNTFPNCRHDPSPIQNDLFCQFYLHIVHTYLPLGPTRPAPTQDLSYTFIFHLLHQYIFKQPTPAVTDRSLLTLKVILTPISILRTDKGR